MKGELQEHCLLVQEQAEEREDILVKEMAGREGVTEQIKARDQMLWVRKMNSIKERAEEMVREEMINCL